MRLADTHRIVRRDAAARIARGARGRDQAVARAAAHGRVGELYAQREAGPAAVGGRAPAGRDRDADLWRLVRVERQPGERNRRPGAEPRKHHITRKRAASKSCPGVCALHDMNTHTRE